jgi:quinoprotein glucose dehydrogenase
MADYFWSARFICGAITLALGIAMLAGGLMFLPHGGPADGYYPAVGALLCFDGVLLALWARAGLALYALLLLLAGAWTLAQVGLNLWALMPHGAALLLWGGILLALRHRIAPTHDPAGKPRDQLRALGCDLLRSVREHSLREHY